MKSSKISVIIPTYNYGRFIGEAIESVLAQTFPASEVIVVDDGSSDNTEEIVGKFGDKVKYIKQKNGGVGLARNTGVKHSSGDLIAFLDADDIWLPNKLEKQVDLFQSNPKFGYVSCGMREFDVTGKTIGEYIPLTSGWSTKGLLLFNEQIVASGSAIVVRKEIFEKVKGFDNQKDLHPSEDWDFARRISEVCDIGAVPELLVKYRNHGTNSHLKIPNFERAMLLAYEKTFMNNSNEIQNLKGQSYGVLHRVLAGSYFHARNYGQFIKHLIKSIWFYPQNITYFVEFPIRQLKNNILQKSDFK